MRQPVPGPCLLCLCCLKNRAQRDWFGSDQLHPPTTFQCVLHAGSTSVTPAQDEDTGKRLIRSASEKEGQDKTKKKSEKRKGKKRKAIVKKGKSVDKKTQKKGKRQRLGNQGKKKNRSKKLKGRRKTKQSIVFSGENCDFIDFTSVRTLGAGCVDGTKMVLKNK